MATNDYYFTSEQFSELDADQIDHVIGLVGDRYHVMLKDDAPIAPVVAPVEPVIEPITAQSLFNRLCGCDMGMDEVESLARLRQAVNLLPLSPIKTEVQAFLESAPAPVETAEEWAAGLDAAIEAADRGEVHLFVRPAPVEQEVTVKEVSEMNAPMTRNEIDVAKVEVEAFRAEADQLQDELEAETDEPSGVPCFICGRYFQPDPGQMMAWGNSGLPWDPTEWECLDCIEEQEAWYDKLQTEAEAEDDLIRAIQEREHEADMAMLDQAEEEAAFVAAANLVAEMAAATDNGDDLNALATTWATPAAMLSRFGTVADPADRKHIGYVRLPFAGMVFVFRMRERPSVTQAMRTFDPAKWLAAAWDVCIAHLDERTGRVESPLPA